ncbi:MAG: phosphoesterase RecJ domain-containing protein [Parcubacteria group bacterium Gr01-1014_38]|nr:MAG: phosphoesterase RecJ domain-containing protein [Parcubacteria group bacterium Gr01-1014_38]
MNRPPAARLSVDPKDVALARDLLRESQRIVVTTHRHPDGDAIGSLLGVTVALRASQKDVTAHTPNPPPEFLRFLPGFSTITHTVAPLSTVDLALALDHSELHRTGLERELLEGRRPVIAIDHHATADRKASIAFVVPEAAATAEILEGLLPELELLITPEVATCLLTGIITDTGSFQHANTSTRVLETAARLVERGADLHAITAHIFAGRSLSALRIAGRAIERLTVNPETKMALSVLTKADLEECGVTAEDLTGVVNLLNTIPEASFSLLLTEIEEGKIKGSLRSEPEAAVDVSSIAQHFGGGGHRLASGFEVAGRLVRDETGWRVE